MLTALAENQAEDGTLRMPSLGDYETSLAVSRRLNIPLLDGSPFDRDWDIERDASAHLLIAGMRQQCEDLMAYQPEEGWNSPVDIDALRQAADRCGVQWDETKKHRLSSFLLDGFSGVHHRQQPQSIQRELMWQDMDVRLQYLMRMFREGHERLDWRYELSYMNTGPGVSMQESSTAFWQRFEQVLDPAVREGLIQDGVPVDVIAEEVAKRSSLN